ncbi:MAG TPA: response regulator transcription factor [Anaerolineae bacterium]|jgi:two-component system, OmpR family, response regulator VicR|nr:response regulator transcription factor [Anaerolineae bacterium]
MPARILVVDDEPPIVDVLVYNLQRAHYDVDVAYDGQQALDQARRHPPDLVILDLMLPGVDGLDVCRALRRERDVPIIMLTARDSEVDRVVGLELGADDYVVKPFSVRELMARVKNVLRRTVPPAPPAEGGPPPVRAGDLTIDAARYEAEWAGARLELTTLEFELLHTLARHAGQVLSREQLLELVWGYDYFGDTRAVDAAIKRLRASLRAAIDGEVDPIATVRGVGYKLVLE